MFSTPRKHFFKIFWGSLLQRTTKLTSTQIIRIIFFSSFFFSLSGGRYFSRGF
jgi:hypothetical protein